jgi:hypothetical protein
MLEDEYSPDHNCLTKSSVVEFPAAIWAAVMHGTHCNLVELTPFTWKLLSEVYPKHSPNASIN